MYRAARRATRFLFIVSLLCYIMEFIWIFADKHFPYQDYILFTQLGIIPLLAFIICLIIYEGKRRLLSNTNIFFWRTAITCIVILLPIIYLLLRNILTWISFLNGLGLVGIILILIFIPFGIYGGAQNHEDIKVMLIRHVFEIMWMPEPSVYAQSAFGLIEKHRVPFYIKRDVLESFQNSWISKNLEALEVAKLTAKLKKHQIKYVLDIGGGEGIFTRKVLEGLKKRNLLDPDPFIVMVDPIDWETDYRNNLTGMNGNISFLHGRFGEIERISKIEKFDFIIAAHSIYGMCDSQISDRVANLNEVINRIFKLKQDDGRIVIVMASMNSRAYEFKKEALNQLFGNPKQDLIAEDLRFIEKLSSACFTQIDGVFNLTKHIDEWNLGQSKKLINWLQYFLRAPISDNSDTAHELKELIMMYVQEAKSLPEYTLSSHLNIDTSTLIENDLVLLHKTQVWIA